MKDYCQAESALLHNKLISVVLPVYNGALYLQEAIDSILAQSYSEFELIIIDDGSNDNSSDIIRSYSDLRIRFYQQQNQGLAATLNNCIALATGEYIARQDQDDTSYPDRLAKQVEFLNNNLEYGMVGTWAEIWEKDKSTDRAHRHPTNDLELKFELLFNNPFVHSSMMIRKEVFDNVGGYSIDKTRQPPEDYEMWSRVAKNYKVANLPEMLHVYREMPQSMSRTGDNPFLRNLLKINTENLAFYTSSIYSQQAYYDLAALTHGEYGLYSGKTRLKEMISIIRDATKNLQNQNAAQIGNFQSYVDSSLSRLNYHYFQSKNIKLFGNSVGKLIHKAAKFIKHIISTTH